MRRYECRNCKTTVENRHDMIWVCTPQCYLDWFGRHLWQFFPGTQGWAVR